MKEALAQVLGLHDGGRLWQAPLVWMETAMIQDSSSLLRFRNVPMIRMTKPISRRFGIAVLSLSSTLAAIAPAAAQSDELAICTDRPTNGNAVCTVPKGHFQVEMDLLNWSRFEEGSSAQETLLAPNPTFKYGLSARSDIQINVQPNIRVTEEAPFGSNTDDGFGDILIRYKHRLSADDATVGVGIIPFITIPTGDAGFGADDVTGGVALPLSIPLPNQFTLVASPQVNIVPDADGTGYHLAAVNLLNIGRPVGERTTLYAELYASNDFDPSGEVNVYTADFAVAHLVTPRFQIDAGVNVGLNQDAPDVQVYTGLSVLF
ncbi:MAG: transporter [Parvularcula sp.]|nr:transporter [Parvularcula sp.]